MSGTTTLKEIEQGADWHVDLTRYWLCDGIPNQLIDMTGFTAILQLRRTPQSFPVLTLTEGAGITFQGVNGMIDLDITAAQSAAIPPGDYIFDLKITSTLGDVERLLEGKVRVSAEVSREL